MLGNYFTRTDATGHVRPGLIRVGIFVSPVMWIVKNVLDRVLRNAHSVRLRGKFIFISGIHVLRLARMAIIQEGRIKLVSPAMDFVRCARARMQISVRNVRLRISIMR